MTILGTRWAKVGDWYGWYCLTAPILIALIGLLIALLSGATGATVALAWLAPILLYIAIALAVIAVVLLVGGALMVGWLFVSDMFANFIGNWLKLGPRTAWALLKADIKNCSGWFASGAQSGVAVLKPYVAPVAAKLGSWWTSFRKTIGF